MASEYLNLVKNTSDTYNVTDSRTNGASPSVRNSNASNPISAVNPTEKLVEDGNAVGDKFTRTTGENKSITAMIDTESEPSVIGERIRKICKENGLDIKQLISGIDKITGLDTKEKRSKLSDKQRTMVLAFVECILNRVVYEHKHKNPNVPILDGVLNQAYILTEYIIKGKTLDNLKEIDNNAENLSDEFLSAISNYKSDEELYAQIDAFEAKMKAEKEEFEKSIENLPEDERKQKKRAKFDSMASLIRNLVFARISVGSSNEVAVKSSSIVPSDDLGKRTNELYNMQSSDEGRKEIANEFHSFGLDQRILAAYQARGEVFNKESWEEYVQVNTSWKNEENLTQYHNDVMTAANEGKLDKEVVKATAKGIGVGAQINHVMTKEQIDSFVNKWTKDIEKYFEGNPEALEEIKASVKQQVEEYNNKLQLEQAKEKSEKSIAAAPVKLQNSSDKHITDSIQLAKQSNEYYKKMFAQTTASSNEYEQKKVDVRSKILSGELNTDTEIKEALGIKSGYELVMFYASDLNLRALKKNSIREYILNENPNNGNLQSLVEKFPVLTDLVMLNMRGDKQKFAQDLINNHKLGYDTTQSLKRKSNEAV